MVKKNFSDISINSVYFRLTVFLAAFRYVFLSCKTLSAYVSSPERALIGVSIIVIISTILCIPSYVEHRIVKVLVNDTSTNINEPKIIAAYRFEETAFSKSLSLRETVFVVHSVIFKLFPCVLLLLFSFLLIQQLRHALQQSEALHRHSSASTMNSSILNGRIRGRRREKENRRTTLMLVIVCVLFLVTELPQGAILLLTFLSKDNSKFYFQIYQHLGKIYSFFLLQMNNKRHWNFFASGDTFDILALINNSVNFILYCLMSRAFRDTFKQTFCFCEKTDRQQSTSSFAQASANKSRKRHLNQSIACETVPTYKCPDGDQSSSTTPMIKTLTDDSNKKKKRTTIAVQFFKPMNS